MKNNYQYNQTRRHQRSFASKSYSPSKNNKSGKFTQEMGLEATLKLSGLAELDQKEMINLFSQRAHTIARKLHQNKLTYTQARKFYDEVINLQKLKAEQWEQKEIALSFLRSKIHYAYGRGVVPLIFLEYLDDVLAHCQDGKTFQIFTNYFEAVICFLKYEDNQKGARL